MVRIERVDNMDDFSTLFIVEITPTQHQEVRVPIWLADTVEANMKAFDFDALKSKGDRKDVLV